MDLANEYNWGISVSSTAATATVNGSSVDMQDCGPEIVGIFKVGPNNPGDDTTIDWKIQESDDDSTFTDVTGATGTQVAGDATGFEVIQVFNRSKRYVRVVATLGGTSPTPDLTGVVGCKKRSY